MTTIKQNLHCSVLKQINRQRKRIKFFFFVISLATLLIGYLSLQNIVQSEGFNDNAIYCIISFGLLIKLFSYLFNEYYKYIYQRRMAPLLVNEILPNSAYSKRYKINYFPLHVSNMFPGHNVIKAQNLIKTELYNTNVEFYNLYLELKIKTSKSTYRIPRFNGCVVKMKLKENTPCQLIIRKASDLQFEITQKLYQFIEKIDVVAPKLTKKLSIWSNNQVMARKILKPAILAKLEDLIEEYTVWVSAHQDMLFFAIDGLKLNFNPNTFWSQPKSFNEKVNDLQQSLNTINNIINTLMLHERVIKC